MRHHTRYPLTEGWLVRTHCPRKVVSLAFLNLEELESRHLLSTSAFPNPALFASPPGEVPAPHAITPAPRAEVALGLATVVGPVLERALPADKLVVRVVQDVDAEDVDSPERPLILANAVDITTVLVDELRALPLAQRQGLLTEEAHNFRGEELVQDVWLAFEATARPAGAARERESGLMEGPSPTGPALGVAAAGSLPQRPEQPAANLPLLQLDEHGLPEPQVGQQSPAPPWESPLHTPLRVVETEPVSETAATRVTPPAACAEVGTVDAAALEQAFAEFLTATTDLEQSVAGWLEQCGPGPCGFLMGLAVTGTAWGVIWQSRARRSYTSPDVELAAAR